MKIVLTGAPGTGKTSIINKLSDLGHNIISEPARTLIEEYRLNSPELLPHVSKENRIKFQDAIEKITIDNYLENISGFFDRSILDEIGYRNRYKINISENLDKAAREYRYDKVFIFPYWNEIFKNDDVRYETSEEAEILSVFLHDAYVNYGYSPIVVPKLSILDRLKFILNEIN